MSNEGDGLIIDVWWTPDCGCLHIERNPVYGIGLVCPDGLTGFAAITEGRP